MSHSPAIEEAAQLIHKADALIIIAGIGMSTDSGLPDVYLDEDLWRVMPPYAKLGLTHADLMNPLCFVEAPEQAWGYFASLQNLYRDTKPHAGYATIKRWLKRFKQDYFVLTTNMDGQFQQARFAESKICEIQGNIHYHQCAAPCGYQTWKNKDAIEVDASTLLVDRLPSCHQCRDIARPNVLMYHDFTWISKRSNTQFVRFEGFLENFYDKNCVILELGTEIYMETLRQIAEKLGQQNNCQVIRIHPEYASINRPHISIKAAPIDALTEIDESLKKL